MRPGTSTGLVRDAGLDPARPRPPMESRSSGRKAQGDSAQVGRGPRRSPRPRARRGASRRLRPTSRSASRRPGAARKRTPLAVPRTPGTAATSYREGAVGECEGEIGEPAREQQDVGRRRPARGTTRCTARRPSGVARARSASAAGMSPVHETGRPRARSRARPRDMRGMPMRSFARSRRAEASSCWPRPRPCRFEQGPDRVPRDARSGRRRGPPGTRTPSPARPREHARCVRRGSRRRRPSSSSGCYDLDEGARRAGPGRSARTRRSGSRREAGRCARSSHRAGRPPARRPRPHGAAARGPRHRRGPVLTTGTSAPRRASAPASIWQPTVVVCSIADG